MAKTGIDRRVQALLIVGLVFGLGGGIASNALDLDHPLALILKGLPITWENLATRAGRPLHIPAALVACIGSIVALPLMVRRILLDVKTVTE